MSEVRRESVKQWFDGTLYSRLDSKKDDVIVIVMQRVHVDDLVGHVLGRQRPARRHVLTARLTVALRYSYGLPPNRKRSWWKFGRGATWTTIIGNLCGAC